MLSDCAVRFSFNDNLDNEADEILLHIGGLKNIKHSGACATRLSRV
ncbi:MAG: PTS transporter subunit EIIB [Psychromonas sp.]|nr:PTS transporter subunit EIIB [Psychromonas sp.]